MNRIPFRRSAPWLGLAFILILYVVSIVRLHPANLFGLTQDDTIYFSSAQSLAAGKGYILPSVPGTPAATKYPVLYPWILSWVWRTNPSFPSNLNDALGTTVAFGMAYVVLAFLFLRRLRGIGEAEALLLTAFCALHPTILFYSSSVVSDIPFSALALGAMLTADQATRREAGAGSTVTCGILTGLTMLMRLFGVPIAAGIIVAALARRSWKQAILLLATITPVVAWMGWRLVTAGGVPMPASFDLAGPASRQTWLYYTNYVAFRKLSMANVHLISTIFVSQLTYFFTELPGYFLSPLFHRNILLLFVCTAVVFCAIFAGLVRQAKSGQWQPIHVALLFTIAVIFSWNYPEIQRFLMPFFPLFAGVLWLEGKWALGEAGAILRAPRPWGPKAAAAALGVLLCAGGLGIAWNFAFNGDRASQRRFSLDRGMLFLEKREAYDWLRQNTPADTRLVAGEDASVYLYTGRQAMAHIALQRAGAYDESYLQTDLAHLTDVAKAIGAQYWLASSDDSDKQWTSAKPFLAVRYSQIENALPEVFHSSGGHVRIYGLGCLQHPEVPACQAADLVLFASGRPVPIR